MQIESLSRVVHIDHMGDDLRVVNAARVSFAKQSSGVTEGMRLMPTDGDKKLIQYLADHEHISPFFHPQVTLHFTTPIFLARQLMRHVVGLALNEESRRYIDTEPAFFKPDQWRKRDPNKKQGSKQDEFVTHIERSHMGPGLFEINAEVEKHYLDGLRLYNDMIAGGTAPEQARMVLPLAMFTQWYWTGSLFAWARVCRHRLAPDAQKEVRDVATQIDPIMRAIFPTSWSALID